MNPDLPSDARAALEASLTALLLGELPHEEAAALHQKLAQDTELAKLYERLKQTINLVRETVASPAQKIPEPLLPLRLEEKRRQKLLAHLKTAAPGNLDQPRRHWAPSLVEVLIVVGLLAILSALLLPAFSKAKSKSMRLATLSRSMEETEKSALRRMAPPLTPRAVPPDNGRLGADGRTELFASEGATLRGTAATWTPAQPATPPAPSKSTTIALPEVAALGEGEPATTVNFSIQGGPATPGSKRGYYDESLGRTGGVSGGSVSDFGHFKGVAKGSDLTAGVQRTEPNVDFLYSQSGVGEPPQGGRPASGEIRGQVVERPPSPEIAASSSTSLGLGLKTPAEPVAPAATPQSAASAPALKLASRAASRRSLSGGAGVVTDAELAKGVEVAGIPLQARSADRSLGDLVIGERGRTAGVKPADLLNRIELTPQANVARDDKSKDALDTPVAGGSFRAGSGELKAETKAPAVGYAMSVRPASEALYFGHAYIPKPPAAAEAQTQKYQWYMDGDRQNRLADAAGRTAPVVGDMAALGRLYQREGTEVERIPQAKVEGRFKGVELAKRSDEAANGVEKTRSELKLADAVAGTAKKPAPADRLVLLGRQSADGWVLEGRFAEQEQKVREAQKKVDDLRASLNISDGMAGSVGPSPLMTADTLHKLEGVRIESKAEYVRQATLSDRLKKLEKEVGPEVLAQVLTTAAPDSLLSSLLEQQTVAEQRLASVTKEHGPQHPEVVKAKSQVDELHTEVKNRVDGIMLGLDSRLLSLSNSLDNLEREVAKAASDDVAQANLTRPYFEAKQELEELKRFRQILGMKVANDKIEAANTAQPNQADALPPKPAAPPPVPQPEVQTAENAFSTFSLNVSDVSFKLAGVSLEKGVMPEPASVRSEEFINAFDYRDPEPPPGVPVAFAWERARYPFAQNRDLLRFSIKTAAQGRQPGRPLNLVLLLDNSGSMERADRVGIIREALRVLATQLQPQDKFSVVTFSRTARLWVDGVPGNKAGEIVEEISGLTPQGGTNLEDAMNLAYQTALRHYLANGINRVVLLTDGAANLGNVDPGALKQTVEANRKQGIALDCFGIGWEGYNDDLLEVLSRNGDGRYGFVNTPEEAATEFAGQLAGALRVAASDVKVQVEFNPARVTAYRQIGYAKHQLTKEQFRDNTVDAAEIGAAESGNALYVVETNPRGEGPLAIVRVRYKVPGTSDYREQEWVVPYTGNAVELEQASPAMRLAAVASAFSEWLVSSPYAAEVTPDRLLAYLSGVPEVYGADPRPKRLEWMIRQAKSIAGK